MGRSGFVATLTLIVLAGCHFGAAPGAPASEGEPASYTYRDVNGRGLRAYVFTPSRQSARAGRPAAVLLFHGGGWSAGEPAWTFAAARRFAAHGLVAIPVEYRLSEGPDTPIEALSDVCAAFRWARTNASRLGLDSARVAGYGVSAGGHLVASTVTVGCPAPPDTSAPRVRAEPDAVLLWSPALDLAHDGWFGQKLQGRVTAEAYSPLAHVRAPAVPTSIVQGEADTLTPAAGARRYCAQLVALGGVCDLNLYPRLGHLLTRTLEDQENSFDPDPAAVADGAEKHLRFLRAQGFIGP